MNFRILVFIAVSVCLSGCDKSDQAITQVMKNMVFVQGGTFEMGDTCQKKYGQPCTFANEGASFPVHTVTVDSFYIAKYKVTYKDYDRYTRNTGLPDLKMDAGFQEDYPKLRSPDLPATANWQLSRDYCEWLGDKTGLPFNLPTEAQWEYAARNRGQDVHYGTNDGHFRVGVNAPSYKQQESYSGVGEGLLPVGKYPATPLGLFDMGTNGPEWMSDWYSKTYYQHSPQHNPVGPENGTEKSLRGMPTEDDRADDSAPTATTMFRMGKEPLLKSIPPEFGSKYNEDYSKAKAADTENDPYKIAKRGFIPNITFRCVINAHSLPAKYLK
ncbi:formylglycine-generating enzyme family protein [Rahnella contaminans]|uniref:formylglycine-generating enzyme family protein n=1 Tax=Rahnella contaminans TaxID=2703882 RepID=UPI0023D9EFD2|nr:SUMF1/EgtB/PvdO family nonheme iron enzyme [Rahnella contaminans]MDF1897152.1 SUMF1/EgtB/PvdO family nonheme iron enzyme [Rahnella contaminans]